MTPHHFPHHVLQAGAIVATGDVPSQREPEASTKRSKRCDISRVTSVVQQIEKFETVPEAMSDNDFASYFSPHDFPDNMKWSRARMATEVIALKTMNGGAIVRLALDVSAPRSDAPIVVVLTTSSVGSTNVSSTGNSGVRRGRMETVKVTPIAPA